VASDERQRRLEDLSSTPAARTQASAVRLGLIEAPDIPEIARELASELPDLLTNRVDDSVSWEVPVVVDPLTGTDREAPEILDVCRERMLGEGWDLALCLSDLPVYRSGRLVAADVSAKRGVAGLSLPAMGAMRLRPRARELTLRLAQELYERTKEPGADDPPARGSQPKGSVGSFRRVDPPDEDMKAMDVEARLAATGAYVLVISSMWLLADAMGFWRLLALMAVSIVAMVVWIIVSHHLWERPEDPQQRKWAPLYNGVSVLSVSVAVLLAYAILFALLFVAAWVFVPVAYFQSTLKHPVGLGEYLTLSWLGASLATMAGALGASLEDEETVRAASYGYRQRRRHENDENPEEKSRDGLAER
jgi:hypothetical protein